MLNPYNIDIFQAGGQIKPLETHEVHIKSLIAQQIKGTNYTTKSDERVFTDDTFWHHGALQKGLISIILEWNLKFQSAEPRRGIMLPWT